MINASQKFLMVGIAALLSLAVYLVVPVIAPPVQPVHAQNRTQFSGIRNAWDYAYGVNRNIPPLRVDVGNTTTGSATITLSNGVVALSDGTTFYPFTPPNTTGVQITVGSAANLETVTTTTVSCLTPSVYSTCQVTATFANLHGQGDLVTSGTYGMAEAVAQAHNNGGGLVAFDAAWVAGGGVTSQFAGKVWGWTNVTLLDYRGTTGATSWIVPGNGTYYRASAVTLY